MEFVIIAYDGTDEKALARRLSVREEHLAIAYEMNAAGKMLCGGAILDDSDRMVGSVVICNFESRAELDAYLKTDPYVTKGVWKDIEVHKFRVGPMYKNGTPAPTVSLKSPE
jgi:uncharacterized protein YciI